MTKERKPMPAGQEKDDRVTRAYRELATERAPDHLDRAVLGKARAAARPRYSRLRSWTRPLAWAATVMLSVAIVLQIDEIPGPESIGFDDAESQLNQRAGEAEVPAIEAVDDAPSDTPSAALLEESPAAMPARSPSAATLERDDAAAGRVAEKIAAPEPALKKEQRAGQLQEYRLEQQPAAPEAGIDAFAPQDPDMLQRAAEMARTQSGENKNSVPDARVDGALELSSIGLRDELPICDETATRTPETWLECIAELEEAGFKDAARLEHELLRREFPDFEAR